MTACPYSPVVLQFRVVSKWTRKSAPRAERNSELWEYSKNGMEFKQECIVLFMSDVIVPPLRCVLAVFYVKRRTVLFEADKPGLCVWFAWKVMSTCHLTITTPSAHAIYLSTLSLQVIKAVGNKEHLSDSHLPNCHRVWPSQGSCALPAGYAFQLHFIKMNETIIYSFL